MLQVRSKEGDKRWLNPDRDMVYIFPRVVSKVIHELFDADPDAAGFADELGKLFVACKEGKITLKELESKLGDFSYAGCNPDEGVNKIGIFSEALFAALMEEFRVWCLQVKPKTAGDEELDLHGLDKPTAKDKQGTK